MEWKVVAGRPGTILSAVKKNRDVGLRLCELLDGYT